MHFLKKKELEIIAVRESDFWMLHSHIHKWIFLFRRGRNVIPDKQIGLLGPKWDAYYPSPNGLMLNFNKAKNCPEAFLVIACSNHNVWHVIQSWHNDLKEISDPILNYILLIVTSAAASSPSLFWPSFFFFFKEIIRGLSKKIMGLFDRIPFF